MPLKKPVFNLQMALELNAPECDLSSQDALIKSEAARKALESMYGKVGAPKWLDEYQELRGGGWPWRVACYIAWAATPRVSRAPRTQEELATQLLGLTSDRVIAMWRKRNPAIDAMVEMLQGAPLFKHRAEILTALVASAIKPDYRHHADRKLALELMGDSPTKSVSLALSRKGLEMDDLVQMSDEALAELASALDGDETGQEGDDDIPEA